MTPPDTTGADASIALSSYTQSLVESFKSFKRTRPISEQTSLNVSQTVSFLALVYEKIRNAVEYREDHLMCRAAIERILRRRFAMNPKWEGEGENLLRELLWARYFPNGSLGESEVELVEQIIRKYRTIRDLLMPSANTNQRRYYSQFIMDLLSCEIEESLNRNTAFRYATFSFFVYQTLHEKVKIAHLSEEEKNALFLVAVNQAYRKDDMPYRRYHLFVTFYEPLHEYDTQALQQLTEKLPSIFSRIDQLIKHADVEILTRFVRKQLAPYSIFFTIFERNQARISTIIQNRESLWSQVEATCNEKYAAVQARLHGLAIRSLIYIFATKMLFALILEYPVSLYFFNEVNWLSIGINTVVPPLLMLGIILSFRPPDADNTKRIFQRIIDIIDVDSSFEKKLALSLKNGKARRPILVFVFTIAYSLTFLVVLLLIHELLHAIHFNLASEAIFVFFISVIAFFSYRIRMLVGEYRLSEKEGVLAPVVDFFMLPIVSIGKFLSNEVSKINVFIVIFDFFIEAPFKMLIDIVEEWISFVRQRKDEIV